MSFAVNHECPGVLHFVTGKSRVHFHVDFADSEDFVTGILHFAANFQCQVQAVKVLLAHVPRPPQPRIGDRHSQGNTMNTRFNSARDFEIL